jgi:hypothetical protein
MFSHPYVQVADFDIGHWGEWQTPASFPVLRDGMRFSTSGGELNGLGQDMSSNPLLAPLTTPIRATVRDEVLKVFLEFLAPSLLAVGALAGFALWRTYQRRR